MTEVPTSLLRVKMQEPEVAHALALPYVLLADRLVVGQAIPQEP